MDTQTLQKTLHYVRENSPKRKFTQSVDLIVTLRDLDLKKPDNQVDFFMNLHQSNGKKIRICGLVGPELKEASQKVFDTTVDIDEFEVYAKDKSKIKKLAQSHDFFVAQANLMAKVAQTFGRILGPKNKMPNPKAGCVVPGNANLEQVKEKLQTMVRVQAKTSPHVQILVGKEDMKDDILIDNIQTIFNQLVHHLPAENNNVNNVFLKATMGPAVKVGAESAVKE